MTALQELKRHLKPGQVYRRADLAAWSNAVDRHLKQLVNEGTLRKMSPGVYAYPKKTAFGQAVPEDRKLVQAFLKTDDFLLFSPNDYNRLGVGTTQLYNQQVVYNRKRHGHFKLGNRVFDFRMKPYFPRELSKAFLLVDLVNNVDNLAEEHHAVLSMAQKVAADLEPAVLNRALVRYGSVRAKRLLGSTPNSAARHHGA